MFNLFKAALGGAAYASNPIKAGVIHLRQELKNAGLDQAQVPDSMLAELSDYAYEFAQLMGQVSTREKPITYFIQHLNGIATLLSQAHAGQRPSVPDPMHQIFAKYNFISTSQG